MNEIIPISEKELTRIKVVIKATAKIITNKEGAKELDLSLRQFKRIKKRYVHEGEQGVVHKSRGKESSRKISQNEKDKVITEIREKYSDFGPTLAHEKLRIGNKIPFCLETLRKEMLKNGLYEVRRRKRGFIHQLRERRSKEGELVQIDGSPFAWFENRCGECDLLVFIDDATGKLLWLEFTLQESTQSYFQAFYGYLNLHGKPMALYADKFSVFRINSSKHRSTSLDDNNGKTQFGRAMEQLGIELISANSPQAKGRVERANKTLQDRLTKELRLRNISTIQQANKYLPQFIDEFNAKFAVEPKSTINAHRALSHDDNLNEILCIREFRVISKSLTIQYRNKTYQLKVEPKTEYTLRNVKVEIIETMDSRVLIRYLGKDREYTVTNETKQQYITDGKRLNTILDVLEQGEEQRIRICF